MTDPIVIPNGLKVYREDMDKSRCRCCGVPGAEHPMDVVQKCHPDIGLEAAYYDGVVMLFCRVCKEPVAGLVLARKEAQ